MIAAAREGALPEVAATILRALRKSDDDNGETAWARIRSRLARTSEAATKALAELALAIAKSRDVVAVAVTKTRLPDALEVEPTPGALAVTDRGKALALSFVAMVNTKARRMGWLVLKSDAAPPPLDATDRDEERERAPMGAEVEERAVARAKRRELAGEVAPATNFEAARIRDADAAEAALRTTAAMSRREAIRMELAVANFPVERDTKVTGLLTAWLPCPTRRSRVPTIAASAWKATVKAEPLVELAMGLAATPTALAVPAVRDATRGELAGSDRCEPRKMAVVVEEVAVRRAAIARKSAGTLATKTGSDRAARRRRVVLWLANAAARLAGAARRDPTGEDVAATSIIRNREVVAMGREAMGPKPSIYFSPAPLATGEVLLGGNGLDEIAASQMVELVVGIRRIGIDRDGEHVAGIGVDLELTGRARKPDAAGSRQSSGRGQL